MKKIISLAVVLILTLALVAMPVSAANNSPEIDDVISNVEADDAAGYDVKIELERLDKVDPDVKPEGEDDKIIASYSLSIEGNPQYPVRIKMRLAGVKNGSKIYVMAKDNEGKINKFDATVLSDGIIQFSIDKAYSFLTLIADKKTASSVGTSDKTGSSAIALTAIVLVVGIAAAYTFKKKA